MSTADLQSTDLELVAQAAVPPGGYDELEPESPPLIGEDGRVRLSFSRVDTYRTCPLQFRFAYIDKLPGRPGPHLSFGTSIHAALERLYERKIADWPDVDEFVGYLYDVWDTTGFRNMPREEQVRWYRRAQDILRRYHHREKDRFRVAAGTELWFELPVGDEALVVGSIDRLDVDDDGGLHVVDYKTGKLRDREAVARSLQLAIYAMATRHLYGTLPRSVCLDFVAPGVQVRVPIEDIDLDAARRAVLETAAAVKAEQYEPAPNHLCRWCDFRALCPAWEEDAPDALGPAVSELTSLRRRVERDIERLRALEVGVERAREALTDRPDD